MSASSKEIYVFLNSNGVPITGATYTFRDTAGSVIATFTEVQAGLYTVIAETGTYDIFKNGVKDTDLSPHVHIDSNTIPLIGGVISFGPGSDGAYTLDGTQASVSGLFTKNSATSYTLLRNGYFTTLTISAGVTLSLAGFIPFASVQLINNGILDNSGAAGGNATSAASQTKGIGGASTADATGGYLVAGGRGAAGGNGGDGAGAPVAGSDGTATAGGYFNTVAGVSGKIGGHGGDNGTQGALGGSPGTTALAATAGNMRTSWNAYLGRVFSATAVLAPVLQQTNGGSGGGSRGLGTGYGSGGGGGAAGNNGGNIVIVAKLISGSGVVSANGGAGGNGGNGGNATLSGGSGGGGAAGVGGNGGFITVLYGSDISTWTYSIAAGSPGTKGTKGTVVSGTLGTDGEAGAVGVVGLSQTFKI